MRKHDRLSKKLDNIQPSPIRKIVSKAQAAKKQGIPLIDLSLGRPDFDTPVHIKSAAQKAIQDGLVHYSASNGIIQLRESICQQLHDDIGVDYQPDQVLVTAGATEAIYITLQSILNPGDEILAPDPMFVYYAGGASLADANCVSIPLGAADNFKLTAEKLSKYISSRTKALVLTSPHNPTGQVYDRADLEEIANLAREHDFYIVSDDIYSRMLYDETEYFQVAQVPGLKDRTIMIQSFSKCYAMDGWRIGYMVAPEPIIAAALKVHQHIMSCPNTFVQYGAVAALTGPQTCVDDMCSEFDRRRRFMMKALDEIGLAYERPRGAFYIFPSIDSTGMTSEAFCEYIFDEAKVALVPGNAFGEAGEGYVRLSYAAAYTDIEKGMQAIGAALNKR